MKATPKVEAILDCYVEDINPILIDPMVDFIESVDMRISGSGIEYLGYNAFAIYDYPRAEEWIVTENPWSFTRYRLGDGTFHCVQFEDTHGAVEFKLRWARLVDKKSSVDSLG